MSQSLQTTLRVGIAQAHLSQISTHLGMPGCSVFPRGEYANGRGKEWSKIADISRVTIDGKFIYDPEEKEPEYDAEVESKDYSEEGESEDSTEEQNLED
ncbi:hypothetical protein EZV62_024813 [Acer yangbiense]|uniref:Uncharacterized protein n=1 Tax=Acer yangbiense TaxID=1000413 RepID=A0A5C7GW34_9ROSI|nr:hypothetical protein EZV62_024813 [Acer yangbiense]